MGVCDNSFVMLFQSMSVLDSVTVSSDLHLERFYFQGWHVFMYSGYFMDSYILGADLTNQNSCTEEV